MGNQTCRVTITGDGKAIDIQGVCHSDDLSSFVGVFISAMRALGETNTAIAGEFVQQAEAIGGPDFGRE